AMGTTGTGGAYQVLCASQCRIKKSQERSSTSLAMRCSNPTVRISSRVGIKIPEGEKLSTGPMESTIFGFGGWLHATPQEGQKKKSWPDCGFFTNKASPSTPHTEHGPAE